MYIFFASVGYIFHLDSYEDTGKGEINAANYSEVLTLYS